MNDLIKRALGLKRASDKGSERAKYLLNDLLYAMCKEEREEYFKLIKKEI